MERLAGLTSTLAKEINSIEQRKKRPADAQAKFEHAIRTFLKDCWLGIHISPAYECGIHKRSNWYSETPRYRDLNLTYKQTIAAYDGLQALGLIYETKGGYLDRDTGKSDITKYKVTDKLKHMLEVIEGDPFKDIKPDLDKESIILRDRVDGKRVVIEYDDNEQTHSMRKNLRTINSCLARHWPDLQLTDDEFVQLQLRLIDDTNKSPVDFSKRILTRIFSNGSFEQGGRFYRAWWHNVPSELRKHITIDGKRTCEYDYSQLNPHMIYFNAGKDMGSEDAYDRVFNCEHRDIVKEAFNAMMQASTELNRKPEDLDLTGVSFKWNTLKQAILDAHKPIADRFFRGEGNHLQYIDSCMAERLMLHYAKDNHPVLPVHDSFIMHYAFGEMGELEEQMRKAFFEQFKKDIPIKGEIGQIRPTSFDGRDWNDLTFNEQVYGAPEYSLWNRRNI